MIVDVALTPADLLPDQLTDRAVVVFDTLRATTTMTAALDVGVAEIRVFGSLDEVRAAAAAMHPRPLLCGERGCLPPPGFDLGNSPGAFDRHQHAGRTLFMSTTNGTKAIVAARGAKLLLVGAVINASAVARDLATAGLDVLLLCAGTDGAPAMEDLIGAGAVIHALRRDTTVELDSDLARIAARLFLAARQDLPRGLCRCDRRPQRDRRRAGCRRGVRRPARCRPRRRRGAGCSAARLDRPIGLHFPNDLIHNKKPGDLFGRRACSLKLRCSVSLPSGFKNPAEGSSPSELLSQLRLPQGSHLSVAAHSSPHVQSQWVTDHLHF